MLDLIKKEMRELIGKKIIVFFRFSKMDYNIKKSGTLISLDENHFVLEEIKDGRSTYSYQFIVQIMEDKSGEGKF